MPLALRIALVSALAAVMLVGALAHWLGPRGWLDHPTDRKHHLRPTARVGGLALLAVMLAARLVGGLDLGLSSLEWAVVLGMGAMGALDDRFDIRARWKARVGFLMAMPLAASHTWELLHIGTNVTLFGLDLPDHWAVFFPLLVMWYWGVPQAFNLIDGINGLALGLACLLLGALSLGPGALVGAGAAPLWGALLGLLALNYPRARHFLGDCGSLSLGMLFAVLVMERALPVHRGLGFWLMAYPILDVTTVVAVRLAHRRPLGQADRSHLHHWMLDRVGGRAWLATPLLLLLAALPMTRDAGWALSRPVSLTGLLLLAGLSLTVFFHHLRHREEAETPVPEPLRHPFVVESSGPNRVA